MQRRAVRKPNRMHRPTDNLRADHELTTRGVRVLAAIADWVAAGKEFPASDCAAVLRFLREWVLAVHMRKEDEVMAPAVAMLADDLGMHGLRGQAQPHRQPLAQHRLGNHDEAARSNAMDS